MGAYHAGALKADGTLWMWGANYSGQLGDGTTVDKSSPVQVPGSWSQFACGGAWVNGASSAYGGWTLGIDTAGLMWHWGLPVNDPALGTGNATPATYNGNNYVSIDHGENYSIAITNTGDLHTWGTATYGRLGNGNTTSNDASPVSRATGYAKLGPGGQHCYAIKSDGTLYGWGRNQLNQLGGNSDPTLSPINVFTGSWAQVASGYAHTIALKPDGTLWGWGLNGYGQVGINSYNSPASPIQIPGTYSKIAAGANFSVAIKA